MRQNGKIRIVLTAGQQERHSEPAFAPTYLVGAEGPAFSAEIGRRRVLSVCRSRTFFPKSFSGDLFARDETRCLFANRQCCCLKRALRCSVRCEIFFARNHRRVALFAYSES